MKFQMFILLTIKEVQYALVEAASLFLKTFFLKVHFGKGFSSFYSMEVRDEARRAGLQGGVVVNEAAAFLLWENSGNSALLPSPFAENLGLMNNVKFPLCFVISALAAFRAPLGRTLKAELMHGEAAGAHSSEEQAWAGCELLWCLLHSPLSASGEGRTQFFHQLLNF